MVFGFITIIASLLIIFRKRLSLRQRSLVSESLNTDNMSTMSRVVKRALVFALIVQIIGMIVLSFSFIPEFGVEEGLFKSMFTAISAFCNAGFDVAGLENHHLFQTAKSVNIAIMLLAICGGIGFIVFDDVYTKVKDGFKNKSSIRKIVSKFALHTKIVFIFTFVLLILGFVYVLCIEYNNEKTIGNMELDDKILVSAFYSTTTRSVGFSTVDVQNFTQACKIGIIVLMLIGGAPGGTAGGIKVTTLAVIFMALFAFIKGKKHITIFSREISMQTVLKSFAVLTLYILVITVSVVGLTITDNNNVLNLTVEAVSAIGNVGLTTGLVEDFSDAGKINLMILMFLGRVGTVTMALAFIFTRNKVADNIRYPEEKIVVG